MFGYRVEENFDPAKEQRRDRLKWVMGGVLCILIACFFIHSFSMAIFQGFLLTALIYGDSFYVQRRNKLNEPWLRRAILATVPLHVLLLIGIVWLDWAFPNVFPKVIVSVPMLFLTFGVEAVLFDKIVGRFSPSEVAQSVDVNAV
jgi:hypothetical protein